MLILHISAPSRAALLIRKVMALKGCPHGLIEGAEALDPGPGHTVSLQWGRRVFVGPVLATIAIDGAWPAPTLFPNGNRGMPLALDFWSETAAGAASRPRALAAHAGLIARQLADGRAFLQGDAPGLADAEAWSLLAFCRHAARSESLLAAWQARMTALGSGAARDVDAELCAAQAPDAAAQALELAPLAEGRPLDAARLGRLELIEPLF